MRLRTARPRLQRRRLDRAGRPPTAASTRRSTDPGTSGLRHLEEARRRRPDARPLLPASTSPRSRRTRRPRRHRRPGREALRGEPGGGRACAPPTQARPSARRCRTRSRRTGSTARQQITGWMREPRRLQLGLRPATTTARPRAATRPTRTASRASSSSARWCKGLNEIGLRTVMDVVYNHTNASGPEPTSRCSTASCRATTTAATTTGNVCSDSCCDDTAAEFKMMEKLMIDTGVTLGARLQGGRLPLRHHGVPPARRR